MNELTRRGDEPRILSNQTNPLTRQCLVPLHSVVCLRHEYRCPHDACAESTVRGTFAAGIRLVAPTAIRSLRHDKNWACNNRQAEEEYCKEGSASGFRERGEWKMHLCV